MLHIIQFFSSYFYFNIFFFVLQHDLTTKNIHLFYVLHVCIGTVMYTKTSISIFPALYIMSIQCNMYWAMLHTYFLYRSHLYVLVGVRRRYHPGARSVNTTPYGETCFVQAGLWSTVVAKIVTEDGWSRHVVVGNWILAVDEKVCWCTQTASSVVFWNIRKRRMRGLEPQFT